jgi:hypothetical protein
MMDKVVGFKVRKLAIEASRTVNTADILATEGEIQGILHNDSWGVL